MKFVTLLSGGKDSCYSTIKCIDEGHELVCLANLFPPAGHDNEEINSFMYQSIAHVAIPHLAECFGVPLVRRQMDGISMVQSMQYATAPADQTTTTSEHYDEVEDLYFLLLRVIVREYT